MNLVQALEALDKNKKIMVKIGETEEIFYKDREGKIKNDNGFIFIPDFSKEYKIYDERKELPETLEFLKMAKKVLTSKCIEMVQTNDCEICPLSGKTKNRFYCNQMIYMLADIEESFKLD